MDNSTYYHHQNYYHQQPPPPQPPQEYYYQQQQLPPQEYYYHHQKPTTTPTTNHSYIPKTKLTHIPKGRQHINTLFVSGLPDDVIPREIHNLFRRRPGFDSSQLKFTGRANQVVAFVTFFNHQSAVAALQDLDGTTFDPEDGSVLHVELARSNSRQKRKSGSRPYVVIDKRRKAVSDDQEVSSEDGDNESNTSSQSGDPDISNDDANSTEKSDVEKANLNGPEGAENKQTEKPSDDEKQPCSTLFIANLGPKCSEDELKQALSQYPGFNGLRFSARRGMGFAFADYEEVEQATTAKEALHDSTLPSSDRGGIVIEYARAKMRKS